MKTRHRIFLVLLAAAVPISAALAVAVDALLLRDVERRLSERLRSDLRLLVDLLRDERAWRGPLDERADAYGRALGLRVTLIDPDGKVRGDSTLDGAALEALENHATRPEIIDAARAGEGDSRRFSTTVSERMLYMAAPVDAGGRRLGFVRLAVPERDIQARGSEFHLPVLLLFTFGLVAFAAVGYLMARRLARPFEQVAALAERAPGSAALPGIEVAATEEARRLAAAIRRMRESLLASLTEATTERGRLQSVLAGMREGILVVSPDRHVLLTNRALEEIVHVPSSGSVPRLLPDVLREPPLLEAFERCSSTGEAASETVTLGGVSGRTYEVRVQPFRPSGAGGWGAIGVFFDVTQLLALEKVRREFIANVSHELRTPLTAIRAFVETLQEGALEDPEHNREFLEIIGRHCERMQSLINDLTDLSLIETGAVKLEIAGVALSPAVREVLATLRPKSERLEVRAESAVPNGLRVRADPQRLEQILLNLVDNAIKFNRRGGSVRVEAEARPEGGVRIAVTDTGVGIPSDHLEKVFHRFHRVDPSRARDAGGTGLGLAIVKHLMRLHGGSIRVESELGRGSRFVLEFPAAA